MCKPYSLLLLPTLSQRIFKLCAESIITFILYEKKWRKQLITITWKIQTKLGFKLLQVSLYFSQCTADPRILILLHANYIGSFFFLTKFLQHGQLIRWTPSQPIAKSRQTQVPDKRAALRNLRCLCQRDLQRIKGTHSTPLFPQHFQKHTHTFRNKPTCKGQKEIYYFLNILE